MPLISNLRQALDALAGSPLAVVVLQRIDQLAHEAGREVDAGDHDARDLLLLDLVVDAGEGDAELVVGVRDVREVRVVPGHDLRGRLQVDVALLVLVSHVTVVSPKCDSWCSRSGGFARLSRMTSRTTRSSCAVRRGSRSSRCVRMRRWSAGFR